jgi:ATPase family protein associated with various cellular activities (AAA)
VLAGNVNDLFATGDGTFVGLDRLLRDAFHNARYPTTGAEVRFIVLTLRSDGIGFASDADRAAISGLVSSLGPPNDDLAASVATFLREAGTERSSSLVSLTLLAELLRIVARVRKRGIAVRPIAVVIDHAESLLPAGDTARMPPLDREAVKVFADLLREDELWAEAETADVYPDVVLLLANAAAELNARVVGLPKVAQITVPAPGDAARGAFVRARLAALGGDLVEVAPGYPMTAFVTDTRGLTIRALDDLVTAAQRDPEAFALDREAIVAAVNNALAERLGPIIRVVHPDHTMADVIGFSALRRRLLQLRRRFDDPERAPAGITVVGPNGAGKTYILEAFAKETERTVITLSQIRSEWYGKTDVFAEMFEAGVSAFGRILIVVDEAHVAFGSIHSRDTHETEARLTRHIIQMIDDLPNRSRIVWALITTRPDLLDPDFVRAGRCSLFVPIFDPEGDDARAFAAFVARRLENAGIPLTPEEREVLTVRSAGFSAGDYREFADDFADERAFEPNTTLATFLDGWTPSSTSLARERELQILLAALNCDWPELLPERLRGVSKDRLRDAIDALRAAG